MDEERHVITTTTNGPSGMIIAERIIYFVIGVMEVLLTFRFALSLLGANQGNPFANFIFTSTTPLVQPFLNLFQYETAFGVSRLETETIVAMIVYSLIGAAIIAVLRLPRNPA